MADDVIRAGDLVVVVKPSTCCGDGSCIGKIYRVVKLSTGGVVCARCLADYTGAVAWADRFHGFDFGRLKKIPPDIVEQEDKEGITA